MTPPGRLARHADAMLLLGRAAKRARQAMLATCSTDMLKAIVDLSINVLTGGIRLTADERESLRARRSVLRRVRRIEVCAALRTYLAAQPKSFFRALTAPVRRILRR